MKKRKQKAKFNATFEIYYWIEQTNSYSIPKAFRTKNTIFVNVFKWAYSSAQSQQMNLVSTTCLLQMKLEQCAHFDFILLFIFCCIFLYWEVPTISWKQTWQRPNRVAGASVWGLLFVSLIPKTHLIFCKIGSWILFSFWYLFWMLGKTNAFPKAEVKSKFDSLNLLSLSIVLLFVFTMSRMKENASNSHLFHLILIVWSVESKSTMSIPPLVWLYLMRTCGLLLLLFETFTVSCKVVRSMIFLFPDFFLSVWETSMIIFSQWWTYKTGLWSLFFIIFNSFGIPFRSCLMVPAIVKLRSNAHSARVKKVKYLSFNILHPWIELCRVTSFTKYFV